MLLGVGSLDIAAGAFLTLLSRKKAKQVVKINIVVSICLAALLGLIEIIF
ncbi:MAG: hypothetical protein JO297_06495 [Nitrososphaeraceae archaeon]|nr:hypothetical protein [Nitrososphaeraceae archaeon]